MDKATNNPPMIETTPIRVCSLTASVKLQLPFLKIAKNQDNIDYSCCIQQICRKSDKFFTQKQADRGRLVRMKRLVTLSLFQL